MYIDKHIKDTNSSKRIDRIVAIQKVLQTKEENFHIKNLPQNNKPYKNEFQTKEVSRSENKLRAYMPAETYFNYVSINKTIIKEAPIYSDGAYQMKSDILGENIDVVI